MAGTLESCLKYFLGDSSITAQPEIKRRKLNEETVNSSLRFFLKDLIAHLTQKKEGIPTMIKRVK